MIVLGLVVGLILGVFVGGAVFEHSNAGLGAVFGAMVGLLWAMLERTRATVRALEKRVQDVLVETAARVAAAKREAAIAATAAQRPAPDRPIEPVAASAPPPARSEPVAPVTTPTPVVRPEPTTPVRPPIDTEPVGIDLPDLPAAQPPIRPAPRPAVIQTRAPQAHEPDIGERVTSAVRRWFTEGNVPVKIGVLVLFLGVGALMKYAADQGWLTVPIELRLAGIAAAALAALVFAWTKRETNRPFALSLQGGAIGVLILVVFGAYRLWALLTPGVAFALLLVLVAGLGLLAVLQDALALAVLGIIGGFLAPILTSSNSGNHVALFTYYAVLNAAIFGIAWIRPWRALNLLGFAFTFGIGTAWGVLRYRPELFASTEPFLVVFYAFYLLIPLLYALRSPDERRGFVDGTLVFGTPLLAFPLQAALLQGDKMNLALSAVVLAAVYVALAWFALRRLAFTLLGQTYALLALGFATLAVPLALSARSTACAWAVEGAALVWLGLRQNRQLPRWIGTGLQIAAAVSLLIGGIGSLPAPDAATMPILNGEFLAIALVAFAGLLSARLFGNANDTAPAALLFIWGLVWWVVLGANEIHRFVAGDQQANASLAFIALTTLLASELRRHLDWRECAWPALLGFGAAALMILPTDMANHGPLGGLGLAAWLAWFVVALRSQANLRASNAGGLPLVHFVHTWTWVVVLGIQAGLIVRRDLVLPTIWQALATLAPAAVAFWGTLARRLFVRWPLADDADTARPILLGSLSLVLGLAWTVGLFVEGAPAPLAYVPVLNPLELAQITFVIGLLAWYRSANAENDARLEPQTRATMLALIGFALLTSITLRCVHFFGAVPWDESLLRSPLAQAWLSVVWCVAGLVAMIAGARRGARTIWLGGATLLGLVIVKLIVIDRQHLNDLSAIFGVLAVGLLLLVVGYFAPVPPRAGADGARA